MSNNQILKDHIRERATVHASHELFTYIVNGIRLPMGQRFSQLNKFMAFSFQFSAMMSRIVRHYESRPDRLSQAIVEHAQDDIGHGDMLLDDFSERMEIDHIPIRDIGCLLYAPEHQFMLDYADLMSMLCHRVMDAQALLVCLLEAIEGSSQAMLEGYRSAAEAYEHYRGMRFRYLGEEHRGIEQGHRSLFDWVEVPDDLLDEALALIDEHFDNAWRMLDASLQCTKDYEEKVLAAAQAG